MLTNAMPLPLDLLINLINVLATSAAAATVVTMEALDITAENPRHCPRPISVCKTLDYLTEKSPTNNSSAANIALNMALRFCDK